MEKPRKFDKENKMSNNDSKIKALLDTIANKKQELGQKPRISYKTNGVFKYENNEFFNINTIVEPQKLVEALSYLLVKQSFNDAAANMLSVSTKVLQWNGYTLDEWAEDFKTRLSVVAWEAKKKELEASELKLKKLVSEDTRTAMEIDEIANLLK